MAKIFSVVAGAVLFATTAFGAGGPSPAGYSLNPSLLADCARPSTAANKSPLRFKADDRSAAIHLATETLFSPYLGASLKAEPEEEGSPSVYRTAEEEGSLLADYRLEAGFDCLLNDNARLNVGYRFAESQPLPTESTPTTLEAQADDLRVSFDFKLPF